MAGQPDHPSVVRKILASKVGADSDALGNLQNLAFEVEVSKRAPALIYGRW